VTFGHRAPPTLRFAAYSAAILDLAIGGALIVVGAEPDGLPLRIAGAVIAAGFWVAPWLLLGVRYEVAEGELIVRRGPVEKRLRLDGIEEVQVSRTAGVDAVLIRHRRGDAIRVQAVQPDDPVGFLRHLQMGARQLLPAGEGVLRRAGA
jgi:hypothetical protein